MADNIETITFSNDAFTDQYGSSALYSGSITVDYTTNSYSGNYTVSGSGINSSGSLSNSGGLASNNGSYTVTDGKFTLTYAGQAPNTGTASYDASIPGFISDTYSTANNPTGQQTQPLTSTPVCYVQGTLIETTDGEVAVENLRVGDLAVTASGTQRLIRWIGHRTVNCNQGDPKALRPVRIVAGAFGENRPSRDLYLSPQHSVAVTCLEGVLIPIKHLINGGSIAQVERDHVTYWHVELDEHDVILAENLPCESFLDTQGRIGFFDNGAEHAAAHPNLPLKTLDDFCRPLVQDGPVVSGIRDQLQRRMQAMGWTLSSEPDLHLVADGRRIDAEVTGDVARFTVPAGTQTLRIRSKSFVPREVYADSGDGRQLGVPLKGIAVSDGLDAQRTLAMDDMSLGDGFSFFQKDEVLTWRWTDGDAALPPSLWANCQSSFFLRLDLAPERGSHQEWTRVEEATVEDVGESDSVVVQFRAAG